MIGLAIADNPENDGHLSPWQEAVGHAREKLARNNSGLRQLDDEARKIVVDEAHEQPNLALKIAMAQRKVEPWRRWSRCFTCRHPAHGRR